MANESAIQAAQALTAALEKLNELAPKIAEMFAANGRDAKRHEVMCLVLRQMITDGTLPIVEMAVVAKKVVDALYPQVPNG